MKWPISRIFSSLIFFGEKAAALRPFESPSPAQSGAKDFRRERRVAARLPASMGFN
jgi:hypothetical protein